MSNGILCARRIHAPCAAYNHLADMLTSGGPFGSSIREKVNGRDGQSAIRESDLLSPSASLLSCAWKLLADLHLRLDVINFWIFGSLRYLRTSVQIQQKLDLMTVRAHE